MTDWFVRNARDARWLEDDLGAYCSFEKGERFPELGVNLSVLQPGVPMCMYHRESHQEDFLVLRGECVLIVEGHERPLRQWDLVHCPPGAEHAIVGAGTTSCVVVAVGARDRSTGPDWGAYTVDEAALAHGAGVERPTTVADEAYARFASGELTPYREGLLPD